MPQRTRRNGDQTFWLVEEQPYRNRSGRLTSLLTWRSLCPECGQPFLQKSGARATGKDLVRRCPDHRRQGVHVVPGLHMTKTATKARR